MRMEGTKIVYEIGDWVTCIEGGTKVGGGYQEGFVFPITSIDDYNDYQVVWKGENGHGVYNDSIRISTQFEINKATQEEKIMVGDLGTIGEREVEFLEIWRGKEKANRIKIDNVTIYEDQYLEVGKKAGWK